MSTRKRNEWLDPEESDEEERGYDSEDESRARMLRSTKRQKVDHKSGSEDSEDSGQSEEEHSDGIRSEDEEDADLPASKQAELARLEKLAASLPSELKLKSNEPLSLHTKPKKDKSGVIYLSSVPPFMKPQVLRSLLSPYGNIGRVFLTPESTEHRQKRLKSGGTRRKMFLDGWVEFLSKKDAKFVAENLNAQTMGGKKRGRWHDEVWNIRYLSGVKWAHLVEQIQNENAERAARLRMEIAKDTRENKRFLENVERAKMIGGIEAKRKKKLGDAAEDVEDAVKEVEPQKVEKDKKHRMEFRQNEVRLKGQKKPEPGQDVSSVLSKMF
ncbi:hypothetical protein BS50DRAFT_568861 [Corynespora cassiicola Philippines]|uniref:18S rRNA factor 2 n=1 Tax=Corynespora cassiicola Philippines TaxID=1448308 RepID=A0A2T2P6G7_CORCC|nr:hypothetical protein BS50DRAFT_568861 [Corynespora cassiicola Philippines]